MLSHFYFGEEEAYELIFVEMRGAGPVPSGWAN